MSIFRSTATTAWRMAGDVRHSVHRARVEGERRVLERRHRAALAALGLRAYALAREGVIPADALAAEIAEVDARRAEVEGARAERAEGDGGHDITTAFPMLADDEPV